MVKGSLKVGVLGAAGRMGQSVCSAVIKAESLELVAAVDAASDGSEEMFGDIRLSQEIGAFFEAEVDVVVDFTIAEASKSN